MKRREFIALLGGAAAWPLAAHPQQTKAKQWRVGHLLVGTAQGMNHLVVALERRLNDLGYWNGRNITILTKFVAPEPKLVEAAIAALLSEIDVLVIWSTVGGVAAKKIAGELPTIFLSVSAPVDIGLVQSLAYPGGTMTGVTFEAATETYGKRLQILKDIVPRLTHVAVLRAVGDTNVSFAMESLERSAPQLGVTLSTFDAKSGNDLELAFAEMQQTQVEGVIVIAGALTYSHGKRIAELSLEARLPSCHGFRETVIAGGLVSLGPDLIEMAGQGATYFDKIARGTKPADLPVQQPARYEMYVNIKTAKILGLELPLPILARADQVIE